MKFMEFIRVEAISDGLTAFLQGASPTQQNEAKADASFEGDYTSGAACFHFSSNEDLRARIRSSHIVLLNRTTKDCLPLLPLYQRRPPIQ